MDRVLRDAGGKVTLTTYDSNGDPADVDGITNPAAGSQVTDSAGAVVAGFTFARTGPGVYDCTFPGNFDTLDLYDVFWVWSNGQSRRTQFELVGGFLFTLADVRAYDAAFTETAYPDAKLIDTREKVEDTFEGARTTGVAFRPRGRREFLDGTGTTCLFVSASLLRRVLSVKIDGVAFTGPELADLKVYEHGEIIRDELGTFARGLRNVEVLYEHGFGSVPGDVWEAGLVLNKYVMAKGPMDGDGRATAVFTEFGGYRLTIAGRDGWTGLPDVDAVLGRYSRAAALGFA